MSDPYGPTDEVGGDAPDLLTRLRVEWEVKERKLRDLATRIDAGNGPDRGAGVYDAAWQIRRILSGEQ